MVKLLPSRNQRPEGFKVKHFLQICLLIAICFWIFNQMKHSYGTTRASLEDFRAEKLSENSQIDIKDIAILGRKHLYPRVNEDSLMGIKEEEIKSADAQEGPEKEREEEAEETEEVEDLIDVDDTIEGNEEKDNDENGNNQLDQHSRNDDELKSQDALLL